jgi:hypothetical protein
MAQNTFLDPFPINPTKSIEKEFDDNFQGREDEPDYHAKYLDLLEKYVQLSHKYLTATETHQETMDKLLGGKA